jgi:hypothetical protein
MNSPVEPSAIPMQCQQTPAASELGAEFNKLISQPYCVVSSMPGEAFPNGPTCARTNSFKFPQKEENKG